MKFKAGDWARATVNSPKEASPGLWQYSGREVQILGVNDNPYWAETFYRVQAKDGKTFFAAESALEPINKDYIPPMVREVFKPQDHIPKSVKDIIREPETV